MSDTKEQKLQELESYKQRLEQDVRRSRNMSPFALENNSPLVRNLKKVNEDIRQLKVTK